MKAIYVGRKRVKVCETRPEFTVHQANPPRNDAGGYVFARAWWSADYLSASERGVLQDFLEKHPEYQELPVFGIRLEADNHNYGVAGAWVEW